MIKNKSIVSNNGLDVGPFNLVNTKDSPNIYYDKRLIWICQVPQLPYLEFNTDINMYQPMKEAIEAVKDGRLYIKKLGQEYINELVPHNFRNQKMSSPWIGDFFPTLTLLLNASCIISDKEINSPICLNFKIILFIG